MKVSIPVSPKFFGRLLVLVGIGLTLINLGFSIYSQSHDSDPAWPISRQFDFSEEGNFGNGYQSVTLLLVANAYAQGPSGRFKRHWIGLACIFLFVSIDEAAQVHETTVSPLLAQFRRKPKPQPPAVAATPAPAPASPDPATANAPEVTPGKPPAETWEESSYRTYWLAAYGLVFAGLVTIYLKFFFHLPPTVRVYFVVAAVLYLGGAVGVEILYRRLTLHHSDHDLISEVTSGIGELMEMLGVAAFVYALMTNLRRGDSILEIHFDGGSPRP